MRTSVSRRALSVSYPNPSSAIRPGTKLSTTMSASWASSRTRSRPSLLSTSATTLPLVRGEVNERAALFGVRLPIGEGTRGAQGVSAGGLDHQDRGAQIGKQPGAVGSSGIEAQVEDIGAFEELLGHGRLPVLRKGRGIISPISGRPGQGAIRESPLLRRVRGRREGQRRGTSGSRLEGRGCGWFGGWGSENHIGRHIETTATGGYGLLRTETHLAFRFWFVPRPKVLFILLAGGPSIGD